MNEDTQGRASGSGTVQKDWWLFLVVGAAMVLVGVLAAAAPYTAAMLLTLLLGWALIIGGVAQTIFAIKTRAERLLVLNVVIACLYLIVGILILTRPMASVLTLTLLLALFLTVDGIVKIARGLANRRLGNWAWSLAGGIVILILGLVVWSQFPAAGMRMLGLFAGLALILSGAVTITHGMAVGPTGEAPSMRPV
jgi:uncharacterized membrane protein HdeD (DUF308 family)